jgi:hypothetical protein
MSSPTPQPTKKQGGSSSVHKLLNQSTGLGQILKPSHNGKETFDSGAGCGHPSNSGLANAMKGISKTFNTVEYKLRQVPIFKHQAYPWNNHDFDYQQVVKNKYTPEKLGISCSPCLSTTINDMINLPNFLKPIMEDPIPDGSAVAGKTDVDESDQSQVKLKQEYARMPEPYPGFLKEYPEYASQLSGEGASSYFMHTGFCKAPSIKDSDSCTKKGFTWVPNPIKVPKQAAKFFPGLNTLDKMGGCYKPRYSFVNNKPGGTFGVFKGIGPTLGKEILELNPVSFINIFMTGKSPSGDFTQLPCKETFIGSQNDTSIYCRSNTQLCCILVIFIIVFAVTKYLLK